MVAKPKRMSRTCTPARYVYPMADSDADGSERAVAGKDTFREKQSAAVAAGARHMKVKTEYAEEDQAMRERETET